MIKAIKGPRNSCLALCVCDDCSTEVSFDAVHEGGHGENRAVMLQKLALKNPGAVSRRLQAMGWVDSGKRLRCPPCEAKRKGQTNAINICEKAEKDMTLEAQKVAKVAVVASLREPTPKQKRLIIMALEDDYDDAAKRYKGGKTDKSIADELGDGILFGWVARVREDLFGPDGGNEEIAAVEAEIKKLYASVEALTKRINAIKAAIGPRAANA